MTILETARGGGNESPLRRMPCPRRGDGLVSTTPTRPPVVRRPPRTLRGPADSPCPRLVLLLPAVARTIARATTTAIPTRGNRWRRGGRRPTPRPPPPPPSRPRGRRRHPGRLGKRRRGRRPPPATSRSRYPRTSHARRASRRSTPTGRRTSRSSSRGTGRLTPRRWRCCG